MEMVVRETIEKHFEYCKQVLFDNPLFREFEQLSQLLGYTLKIEIGEEKSWRTSYFFISIFLVDNNGNTIMVNKDSILYDDIGSPGGCECILSYSANKNTIKKFELSNEIFDDIGVSNNYLNELLKRNNN